MCVCGCVSVCLRVYVDDGSYRAVTSPSSADNIYVLLSVHFLNFSFASVNIIYIFAEELKWMLAVALVLITYNILKDECWRVSVWRSLVRDVFLMKCLEFPTLWIIPFFSGDVLWLDVKDFAVAASHTPFNLRSGLRSQLAGKRPPPESGHVSTLTCAHLPPGETRRVGCDCRKSRKIIPEIPSTSYILDIIYTLEWKASLQVTVSTSFH